jgi:pimeloyl-ACP methyl ester carboxylesterase
LAGRLTGAAIAAGVGRLDRPGAVRGLTSTDRLGYRLGRIAPPLDRLVFGAIFAASRRQPARALKSLASDLSEPDRQVLAGLPDEAKGMAWFTESGRQGARGPVQDYRALHDWGFQLGDVAMPVELWQGDADQMVPMDHAEDLTPAVPDATLHRCPGEGHFLMVSRAEEILRTAAG